MDNSIQNSHAGRILLAAQRGDEAGLAQALAEGADLQARDARGRAPLMLAVMGGHNGCVRMLVDAGARLDAKSGEGRFKLGSTWRKRPILGGPPPWSRPRSGFEIAWRR
jgi:ankyrin repeat protein